MSNELATQNDLQQMLSRSLLDLASGKHINKSKLEKQIAVSDAINRRVQTKINLLKAMAEARKSGIDFSAAIKEINAIVNESGEEIPFEAASE